MSSAISAWRDPAHAVRQAGRAEPVLAEQVALAAAAEHLVVVHPQVVDDGSRSGCAEPCIVSTSRTSFQPSLREVDDERGVGGLRDVGVVLGAGDEDGELRAGGRWR